MADLFISYPRKDAAPVLALAAALAEQGCSVWLDQQQIGEFDPITEEIRRGLAESKALLAWYSEDYPKSRPCQMELTAALIAAQLEGDPRRRVLVVNPASGSAHIEPIELRDARYATAPSDAQGYVRLATQIARHVKALTGALGGILPHAPPHHYGLKLTGATRFVGRLPDLWRIHSALQARNSAIISANPNVILPIVTGLGGVGKSLLAEEYTLRFGPAYSGGIFWLRAFGNDPSYSTHADAREAVRVEQFATVAAFLGIDTKGLTCVEVEARLRARLSSQGKPFLWVVDDLASGLAAEAVRAWLAPSPFGKTLMTTRSREYGAIGAVLPLDVLTVAEAFDLLCSQRAPDGASEEAAARGIVEDLGCHPLAVAVTAAALAVQAGLVSFGGFREKLASRTHDELEFAAELTAVLPTGCEKSVAATLLRSVRSLSEEGQDVLRLASLLAVAPLPPRLIVSAFRRADRVDELEAGQRVARAFSQIERASLAEHGEAGTRLVHVLVSRTIRFHDARPRRTELLHAAVVSALNELLSAVVDIRAHDVLALEVRHSRALCALDDWETDTAALAEWVARHDFERGAYASALQLQEQTVEFRCRVLGENDVDTLASISNLAMTLGKQGDLARARGLQEQVLVISRRLFGEEHPNVLTSMNNLAETLRDQGDLAGARELQEQVSAISRRVLGEEHPDALTSMGNLAGTFRDQGDFARARKLEEQVLAVRSNVLGEEHPGTLRSMNNLAATLRAQGNFAAACALQERVLAISRRVLGEEHPDTLSSMNNLAATLRGQGDLAGARALQERELAVCRRVLGNEHPNTLASMNNLAGTLQGQGDLAGAGCLFGQALEASRRVRGEEHPDTLASMGNLAETLRGQGDLVGARPLQEQALALYRRVLGAEHPDTLMATNNLAETLRGQGDFDGARELQEQVLAIRHSVLGEEHPDTLTSMNNLAGTLQSQRDFPRAREVQEQVLAICRRVLGAEHPDTLRAMNNLATTLWNQGDLAGAHGLQKQVLATRCRVLGDEHPDSLRSMNNLAATLRSLGDLAGARGLHERALATCRRVLGERHPDTLMLMNNLAVNLWDLGFGKEAEAMMAAAAEGFLSTLGPGHPLAKTSMRLLEQMRAAGV